MLYPPYLAPIVVLRRHVRLMRLKLLKNMEFLKAGICQFAGYYVVIRGINVTIMIQCLKPFARARVIGYKRFDNHKIFLNKAVRGAVNK